MSYDVIIVGAGMAGMTAAIYVARAGRSVLVLESQVRGGQIVNSAKVSNFPGVADVSGQDLMDKIYHQVNNLGVEIRYEKAVAVEVIDKEGEKTRFLVKTDESEYSCGAIILAMGTEPRKLSEEQVRSAGERPILYCATCDGALYKDKPVVVVGSGNTAKHEVAYLERLASKVYQIHHDDPIPAEAAAVFVAIGRVPATSWLGDLVELDQDGYVVAGEDCETSRPGVYVAGDTRTKQVRQLVTAAGDGAVAAGAAVRYVGE